MNFNLKQKFNVKQAAVAVAGLALSTLAFAADPTSAVELAKGVDVADAKSAMYIVGGIVLTLVVAGAAITAVIRFAKKH